MGGWGGGRVCHGGGGGVPGVDEWGWDVFALKEATGGRELQVRSARPGPERKSARNGTARPVTARNRPEWHGPARPGAIRNGTARNETENANGPARPGTGHNGPSGHGPERPGPRERARGLDRGGPHPAGAAAPLRRRRQSESMLRSIRARAWANGVWAAAGSGPRRPRLGCSGTSIISECRAAPLIECISIGFR